VVGTSFFGTQELNPLIANMVQNNLPMFVGVKLAATVTVGAIFILTEKWLMHENQKDHSFRVSYNILRGAYVAMNSFLVLVVVNNILVLAQMV
jgi:hypothetical protein